jgi:antitoxin component YwqK of YwqJK toxin-antitoxin module
LKPTKIFVKLLDEGTDVWKPVSANLVGDGVFEILGIVPTGEAWEFSPGAHVRCEPKQFADGSTALVAMQLSADSEQSERETRRILGEKSELLATAEYLDGKLDGVSRVYSPSGRLVQEAHYLGGQLHGPYRAWWDSGNLKESGEYAGGRRIGEFRWFRDDGTLMESHHYGAPEG